MYLSVDQLITLLTTLLFLELFIGALLVWALIRLKRMQANLSNLGQDKYKQLLEWQQQSRFDLMETYKTELSSMTKKAADAFADQLETSISGLEQTTNNGINQIEAAIKKQSKSINDSLVETNSQLTNQLTKEMTEYKQQKIAELEKTTTELANKATKRLLRRQLNANDQHRIVKELLQEAWEEGKLTNE